MQRANSGDGSGSPTGIGINSAVDESSLLDNFFKPFAVVPLIIGITGSILCRSTIDENNQLRTILPTVSLVISRCGIFIWYLFRFVRTVVFCQGFSCPGPTM
uniref:Uncharacterized protein n=1 Tax=Romanomermis culicivorax TaxID=13658 RepID=A0A915HVM0_ROMCU